MKTQATLPIFKVPNEFFSFQPGKGEVNANAKLQWAKLLADSNTAHHTIMTFACRSFEDKDADKGQHYHQVMVIVDKTNPGNAIKFLYQWLVSMDVAAKDLTIEDLTNYICSQQ